VADTLVLSAEDGLADTMRPRLDAAGADPMRVHALTATQTVTDDGTLTRPVNLADVEVIRQAVQSTGARLVIVDVLMAYLPAGKDAHRDQDVRSVLHRVADMAEQTGAAVLLLRHLNKGAGSSPLYRGGGSIGIVGAARAGYVVAPDPDDDTVRVLACLKSNLGPEPPSLQYALDDHTDSGVARVVWGETSEHRAGDLLCAVGGDAERGERDEAVEWLQGYLTEQGGAAPAGEILKAAKRDGIADRTLRRARQRAGVISQRHGFGGGSVWSCDPSRPQSGHSGQASCPGPDGTNGGRNERRRDTWAVSGETVNYTDTEGGV
jgi:hypothetical protein